MFRLLFIILIISSYTFSQNLPSPDEIYGKQERGKSKKPKFDPNKKYKSVNMDFKTKDNRVKYLKKNMAQYILNENIYGNAYEVLFYNAELAIVDTNNASSGLIITVKMSNNSVFAFMIHNLCDFEGETNGLVNVTYFNFKFGEVDASSIKSYNSKKKRLYPNNNTFTEELTIGQIKFIIENKSTPRKMIFAGKEIPLQAFDIGKGFNEKIGK